MIIFEGGISMKVLIIANNDAGLYRFRKELIQELIQPGKYIEGSKGRIGNDEA